MCPENRQKNTAADVCVLGGCDSTIVRVLRSSFVLSLFMPLSALFFYFIGSLSTH